MTSHIKTDFKSYSFLRLVREDYEEMWLFTLVIDTYSFDNKDTLKFREESVTRGNGKKLFQPRARLHVRKYSFSNRVVDADDVLSANTVFSFGLT